MCQEYMISALHMEVSLRSTTLPDISILKVPMLIVLIVIKRIYYDRE